MYLLRIGISPELRAHTCGQVQGGRYLYLRHLLALEACKPEESEKGVRGVITSSPLRLEMWRQRLADCPDTEFVQYITEGIQRGFRIGFNRSHPLLSASTNMPSSNPTVISEYLEREVELGRTFTCSTDSPAHISPLGVIPKRNKPGKWRLIVDLSSPKGGSVNEGIDPNWSTLSYATVDHLATLVVLQGPGAFLVKADVKEAYRMIPIHPDDHHLLGVRWGKSFFIDSVLPFGLRSAPKIFSAVADAAQWILAQSGISTI